MTTHDAESRRADRSTPLLAAAAALVIVVVAGVVLFGVERPPEVEPLQGATGPVPSAAIAWIGTDRDGSCLHVARPDGSVTRPRCEPDGGEVVGWDDGGVLVSQFTGGGPRVLEVDPVTGEVGGVRGDAATASRSRPDDGFVTSHRDGDEQVVMLDSVELWRVAAPASYGIRTSSVSPDGRWVAMVDDADRLLVAPADGSTAPRSWVDDVSTWGDLVWEGTAPAGR